MSDIDLDDDFTDIFCGAGGSSSGLAAAGLKLKLAANHWARAIETHAANFKDAEHLLADVNNYDMRRLPRTRVLWGSPICTEGSPAGGKGGKRSKVVPGQMQLETFGHVEQAGFERTRATFWDIIRATEVHRYEIVIVENVVEVTTRWELFDIWLMAMEKLGYHVQIVSVSAAHIGDDDGNDPAPQWRDRIYIFFTRNDLKPPTISPTPRAWCFACEQIVLGVQTWKRLDRRRIGKYGQQYVYRCPRIECRHSIVEPFVLPALAAIDLSDLGHRIGDRKKPLVPATTRRIKVGLQMFGQPLEVAAHGNTYERPGYARVWPAGQSPMFARSGTPGDGLAVPPVMISVNHDGDGRPYPAGAAPLPTRSTKLGDAMIVPNGGTWNETPHSASDPLRTRTTRDTDAFVAPPAIIDELRAHATPRPVGEDALRTVAASGNHHFMTVPGAFIQKHHGGLDYSGVGHMVKSVDDPLAAVVARPNLSLVIPYRRGLAKPTSDPLLTVGTRTSAGLVQVTDEDVDDCWFRMLKPREHGRAQRFRDDYIVTGNGSEQTMQFGNAVASNVAQWLGGIALDVLHGRAA